ncbi:hypothetical protein, partial [Candidatus Venteria ishoeyi]|uniref:hypothetical protein n=1 Tax=Candidatus Venteria ishoeyi TaxID=1899563 RepID=UPI00255C3886
RKLPPLNAANNLSKEEVRKSGTYLFESDGHKFSEKEIRDKIKEHKKVIFALDYDLDFSYGKYIAFNETVQKVIFEFREEYAHDKMGMKYLDLPKEKAIMVKKKYPIMISEAELDD